MLPGAHLHWCCAAPSIATSLHTLSQFSPPFFVDTIPTTSYQSLPSSNFNDSSTAINAIATAEISSNAAFTYQHAYSFHDERTFALGLRSWSFRSFATRSSTNIQRSWRPKSVACSASTQRHRKGHTDSHLVLLQSKFFHPNLVLTWLIFISNAQLLTGVQKRIN